MSLTEPVNTEKPPTLEDLVKKASDLNMMPQVARKVIDLVSNESSTASQLAELLEKDPNITTRILKISNSAFYGLRREVKTVQQAIVILGFKSLRSMVVASSSKALHKRFGITEQLMWDHSIGTAIAAKIISEGMPVAVGDIAFVGGLLHNVGKTIMNNESPKAYVEVMKKVYNDRMNPIEAELEIFGYSYPQVGYMISEKWGLPSDLINVIRYHYLSQMKEEDKKVILSNQVLKMALGCVDLGAHICEYLGIGFREKNPKLELISTEGSKYLNATQEKIDQWMKKAEEAYSKERAVFN
ncbi:MAG: metal-dependent phosphohydrolase [Bacteriovoracaceae bacterium]|nr:metal-dependent phosphohydrolase [Bacteriovoracaceae bacterium]